MKSLIALLLLVFTAVSVNAETIKIGGSGSMIPLLTEIGKAYMKKHANDSVEVNQKSMGQPGGIAALNAGALDIAMSATPLSAEQSKLGLKPLEIATVAGVVAVSKDVTAANLTSNQLCDIYSGKITNWKQVGGSDVPIIVMTRPESDSTKIQFRKAYACMNDLTEVSTVLNLPKSQDMHAALESKKNAIGIVDAISLSDAAGKFKAIKIEGKGIDSFDSGKWPFFLRNHLVLGKNQGESVKRFIGFVKTAEVQAIIKSHKAKPVQFNY
jgi:phosphate transport system substrate-binding protein